MDNAFHRYGLVFDLGDIASAATGKRASMLVPFRCKILDLQVVASGALTATAGNYQDFTLKTLNNAGASATHAQVTGQTAGSGGHGNLVAHRPSNASTVTITTDILEAGTVAHILMAETGNGKAYTGCKLLATVEPMAS